MGVAPAFDTHANVKRLVAAGVPEAQAEVHAEVLSGNALAGLATQHDIQDLKREIQDVRREIQDVRLEVQDVRQALDELRTAVKKDLADLEARVDARFKESDARVESRFKDLELRITLRFGVMLAAAVTILAVLDTLFK